jgi:hypothetical protein
MRRPGPDFRPSLSIVVVAIGGALLTVLFRGITASRRRMSLRAAKLDIAHDGPVLAVG